MSEVEHRVLYFIRRIFLSIYGTCSRAALVLTYSRTNFSLTLLNSISIRIRQVTKPPLEYNFTVLIIDLANCHSARVVKYSQVINLIFCEKVTRNGIPFTNMTISVKVKNVQLIKIFRNFHIFLLRPFWFLSITSPPQPVTIGTKPCIRVRDVFDFNRVILKT